MQIRNKTWKNNAKSSGKIRLEKEIFTGIGKVNIYIAHEDHPFLLEAESFRTLPAERMKCPNALSKYLRFHEQGTPAVYEIEYKNEKFHVTKKTGENKHAKRK